MSIGIRSDSKLGKKKSTYNVWGLVVAGILGLSILGHTMAIIQGQESIVEFFMIGAPLICAFLAMIIRSFRPPLSFGRGLATVCGGFLFGSITHFVVSRDKTADLVLIILGIVLLIIGFMPQRGKSRGVHE